MKIGIVGRPHVGKTTVFNALARATAETGNYAGRQQTNLSTIAVPDERLERLVKVLQPEKGTSATINYVDVAGRPKVGSEKRSEKLLEGDSRESAFPPALLAELRTVDAIAHVVRLFEDETVPHVDGSVNPERDIDTVALEFTFADLQVIEDRLVRLRKQLQNQKSPALQSELQILEKCHRTLEDGTPLRFLDLSAADEKLIRGYGFLTQKPLLLICNIGESQLDAADAIGERFAEYASQPHTDVIVLAAQLEMEIAQLDEADAAIFMAEMGLGESALARFINTSYRLLGLITFFTGGPKEVRAWTLREGQTAVEAAGIIHTDFGRGFIRAETIHWEALVTCGGFQQARSKGKLRAEGKTYQVQDGDVLVILANPTA